MLFKYFFNGSHANIVLIKFYLLVIWGPNEPTNFDNETHVVITTKLTSLKNNFLLSDVIGASHTGLAFCQYSE